MSSPAADVVVIGAGIVGAACACALARDGMRVTVLESGVPGGGATAAGMGHLVVMDGSEPEFTLTRYSRDLWLRLAPEIPPEGEFRQCGTIWVAAGEEEFAAAQSKHAWYGERGVRSEILDARALAEAEPNLRSGLAGGLLVPDDAVVYAPWIAGWLLQRSTAALRVCAPVASVDPSGVVLASGERIACGAIVCAAGCSTVQILPDLPIRPRKGHLAITDRHPGFVHHQLAELGYVKSAHGTSAESVAFNVQPRATGQVLLGSSRQFGDENPDVCWRVLARMIRHATEFMPALARLPAIRVWTGFRAATPDQLPLIGPLEALDNVTLATGHEGLGITTALATGELVAAHILGHEPAIPAAPYLPSRLGVRAHA
ncbi:MAG: FAD-dependent oxidoreductase [Bryobacteraceae bacterium]|jgi:glycine/D-amino acid oxidase-like deaminating enzyme